MPRALILVLCLVGSGLGAVDASAVGVATVPTTVNVQGVLRDGVGGLESGSFQFTINVYAAATGGASLWTETQASVPVESGFFTLALSDNDTHDKTIADIIEGNSSPLFVGVTLQGDLSELPRIQLNTVPYAFVADHATTVDNFGGVAASAISNVFGGSNKCAAGTAIQAIAADGTLSCATAGSNYSAAAGGGVTVGASSIGLTGLNTSGCSNGQVLTWNTPSNTWSCAASGATYGVVASEGLAMSGNNFELIQTCTNGQTLKYATATNTWACAADNDTTYTSVCSAVAAC